MAKVIGELEACVGEHCYNGNSYDGWRQIEGCGFRYPVKVPVQKKDGETEFVKIRTTLGTSCLLDDEDITPNAVERMYYCFGSIYVVVCFALCYIVIPSVAKLANRLAGTPANV